MRIISTLLILACSLTCSSQMLNMGYSLGLPQESMKDNIKPLHSLNVAVEFRLPKCLNRVVGAVEFSGGDYANTSKLQTFNFGSGGSTETWVNYSSSVMQYALSGRIELSKKKNITPYIYGKAGYACFFSSIYIEDPDDPGGCKALEQKTLIKDGALMTGYGGGLGLNLALFSKNKSKKETWIDLRVTRLNGGDLDYINTKKLLDPDAAPTGQPGKDLKVKFINVGTQEIHEHKVAEVYNTPMDMLEIKLSCRFNLFPKYSKPTRRCGSSNKCGRPSGCRRGQ